MRTSDLSSSRYFSRKDLPEPVVGTISSVKHENIAMESDEEKMKYVMYFEEHTKGFVLGPTTGGQIEEALGSDDSDDWIGKQVELYVDTNVMMKGKKVGGVRVRAVTGSAPAQPPPPPRGHTPHQQTGMQKAVARISEPQAKRLFCIARDAGVTPDTLKEYLTTKYDISSSTDILRRDYDAICEWAAAGGQEPPEDNIPMGDSKSDEIPF